MITTAVTTPTGHVGRHLVRTLIGAGVRPRVLLRDASRLEPEVVDHVDLRLGDLGDRSYVAQALAGADAAYLVLPEDFTAPDPLAQCVSYAESLAAGVSAAGVPRVVLQSSVGAELRHGAGLIDALGRAEELLDAWSAEAGTSVLHLRCGYFMTNLLPSAPSIAVGSLSTVDEPDSAVAWVDPRDVADAAALALVGPAWSGRRVRAVHGPQDLSWSQAAAVVSEALGREVRLERVSDEDRLAALVSAGTTEAAAGQVLAMSSGLRGVVPEQPRTTGSTTPSTLAGWAWTTLRPAVLAEG